MCIKETILFQNRSILKKKLFLKKKTDSVKFDRDNKIFIENKVSRPSEKITRKSGLFLNL
jgi:hypothetical protein